MPIFDCEISEVSEHILYPIILQSVNKIIFDMGLKDVFQNNIDIRTGLTGVSKFKDKNRNQKIRHSRFECVATPQMNPMSVQWSECTTFKHSPAYGRLKYQIEDKHRIFEDPSAQVFLYEQNAPCSIQMSCNMILVNSNIAYSLPSKFYNRYLDGTVFQLEDLMFDFSLPKRVLYVLHSIYKNRNIELPFDKYLSICSNNEISYILNKNDIASKKPNIRNEFVVQKMLMSALAKIEYTEDRPTEERSEKVPNEFHVPFVYTIQFSRPNSLILTYPIVVDNKILPADVIPVRNNRMLSNILMRNDTITTENYYNEFVYERINYIQCPYYDDWTQKPDSILKATSYNELIVAAFLLDTDVKETKINVESGFDKYTLHPYVIQIIREQCQGSFDRDCLFNISIFRNDSLLESCHLDMDEDLNVLLPYNLFNCNYHIVISELKNMKFLNPKYFWLLYQYQDMFDKSVMDQMDNLYPGWKDRFDPNSKNDYKGNEYGTYTPFRVLIADIIAKQP